MNIVFYLNKEFIKTTSKAHYVVLYHLVSKQKLLLQCRHIHCLGKDYMFSLSSTSPLFGDQFNYL